MTQGNVKPTPGGEAGAPPPMELEPIGEAAAVRVKPSRSPFLTRGNLILLAMYAAGIAGLYGLGLRRGPSTALADQTLIHAKVEAALNGMGAPPSRAELQRRSSAKAIVSEFYTAAKQRQVALEALQGNPFVFTSIEPPKPVEPAPRPEPATRPGDDGSKGAMEAVKALKLQSVLVGRQTTAMISNNLVTAGETINGWKVVRITPHEVELSWRDKTYVLEMPK